MHHFYAWIVPEIKIEQVLLLLWVETAFVSFDLQLYH